MDIFLTYRDMIIMLNVYFGVHNLLYAYMWPVNSYYFDAYGSREWDDDTHKLVGNDQEVENLWISSS